MAGLLGVSKSQVSRDSKAGMPMSSADEARAWRLVNLDPSRTVAGRIDRPVQTPERTHALAAQALLAPGPVSNTVPAAGEDGDPAPEEVDEDAKAYRQDRARNERIKADRAEIELQQMRRSLVPVAEVEQLEFTAGRLVRDRMEMLPPRASADLHAMVLSVVPEEHRAAVAAGLE